MVMRLKDLTLSKAAYAMFFPFGFINVIILSLILVALIPDAYFFFFFILVLKNFIQNETLSLVIKITQHIQINI